MAQRTARLLVVVLVAGSAIATVLQAAPAYVAEREAICMDCHAGAAIGSSPRLQTFLQVAVPDDTSALPGAPLDLPVRLTNAWTANLTYLEPRLDLGSAPSVAFRSDVAPVTLDLERAIPVDATQPTAVQTNRTVLQVPEGVTRLDLRIVPDDPSPVTGPDLALRLQAGSADLVVDEHGRGEAEAFHVADRAGFSGLGYGSWTVTAQTVVLRPDNVPGSTVVRPSIPFHLELNASADGAPERVLALPLATTLHKGEGLVATFHLVAAGLPSAAQSASLAVAVHAHYDHRQKANKNDADFLHDVDAPVTVTSDGSKVHLSSMPPPAVVVAVHNGATLDTLSEAVGYASALLLLSSIGAGGMFGKTSRRWANSLFGSARRRIAFHNFLSYGLTVAALAHMVLFLVESAYAWTVGMLWGGLAILAMFGLGVTGAFQVPMIRRWNFAAWKWTHWGLAAATLLLTGAHLAFDGSHFAAFQQAVGWQDPLARLSQ